MAAGTQLPTAAHSPVRSGYTSSQDCQDFRCRLAWWRAVRNGGKDARRLHKRHKRPKRSITDVVNTKDFQEQAEGNVVSARGCCEGGPVRGRRCYEGGVVRGFGVVTRGEEEQDVSMLTNDR
eukprot:1178094-Prorocentrum_minimum.AAC.9